MKEESAVYRLQNVKEPENLWTKSLPFNKWNGLSQDKGRSSVCHHWLLSNSMVSHHNAVPVAHKSITWEPGYEEQETEPSKAGQCSPVDWNQASQSPKDGSECNEANHLSGKPEFPPEGSVHLWCFCWLTVTYKCKRHPIEVVKSMFQRVMAVVIAGFTVNTLMPLPWK